jgi:hypothetical protein
MGRYLEALYHTGYYYPFIGYVQVLAAVLLLIPRTATLGACLYFPIILNICTLSLAVGFEGSLISAPLMVYANLYLLCWDYDKLKYLLPWASKPPVPIPDTSEQRFPLSFFLGVLAAVALTVFGLFNAYTKMPRNNLKDCMQDCQGSDATQPCFDFCDCIHREGRSFEQCSEALKKAKGR